MTHRVHRHTHTHTLTSALRSFFARTVTYMKGTLKRVFSSDTCSICPWIDVTWKLLTESITYRYLTDSTALLSSYVTDKIAQSLNSP